MSLSKYKNAAIGFWYAARYQKTFDLSFLKGKRIVIVGAASSALNTGKGKYIDDFDVVVRVNKAPVLLQSAKFENDIGKRTDILFHSFYENEFSGGGPLDFELYDRLGISFVINPMPGYWGHRFSFNYYKKYLTPRVVFRLPATVYSFVEGKFTPFRPTTGFFALLTLLQSEFSELYITGFTFFRTPYADGYRDALKDVAVNQKYIAESKQHDPDIEYREFRNLLQLNKHKNIVMDETLASIVKTNLS
jgi:hypothetical protein